MNYIKQLRIALNLTQTELGNAVGVKRSVIGHYENERREPSRKVRLIMDKLAQKNKLKIKII